jgi:hypothetical protein
LLAGSEIATIAALQQVLHVFGPHAVEQFQCLQKGAFVVRID